MVLAGLAKGHILYDQVAAMYGPVGFYPKVAIIRLLHLTVDHNVSRTMTWLIYCAGCVTAGIATWRITRQISSFILTTFTTYFLPTLANRRIRTSAGSMSISTRAQCDDRYIRRCDSYETRMYYPGDHWRADRHDEGELRGFLRGGVMARRSLS